MTLWVRITEKGRAYVRRMLEIETEIMDAEAAGDTERWLRAKADQAEHRRQLEEALPDDTH